VSDAPAWVTYSGVCLGIYAAITGTAGLLVALRAQQRAGNSKLYDERRQIKTRLIDTNSVIEGLGGIIRTSLQSRLNSLSATIGALSGPAVGFKQQVDADLVAVNSLRTRIDALPVDSVNSMSLEELENFGTELHDINSRAIALRVRYQAALAEDDQRRRDHEMMWNTGR